jgi:hypothetical protein
MNLTVAKAHGLKLSEAFLLRTVNGLSITRL